MCAHVPHQRCGAVRRGGLLRRMTHGKNRIDDGLRQRRLPPYAPLQHVLHPAGRSKPASNLTPPVARFLAPHTYTQSRTAHSQPERSTSQSVSLSRIPNPQSQASKGIASRKAFIIMVRPAALLLLAALAAPACAFVPRAASPAASRAYTTLPCVCVDLRMARYGSRFG